MKSLQDTYTLSNGVKIPCIGYGTLEEADGEAAFNAVAEALKAGYRHIDTAEGYGNEASVGRAVKASGIPRNEIFVTSKLHNDKHGYANTKAAFEETMEKLGLDYLDLFLVHWPNPAKFRSNWEESNAESWRAFEEFYKAGRIRALGISNFHDHHIRALLKTAAIIPTVNQIRLCPGCTQDAVVAASREHQMILEAYSPLGRNAILGDPIIKKTAEKYHKTPAQICVRFCLDLGFLPLPKSANPQRIRENADVFDFELSREDLEALKKVPGIPVYPRDPDTITF
jgi:diketogulonate reductase-like aldo/keto reductase